MNLKKLLENEKLKPLVQFVKFGIVGVMNTLISYGTEMLCYYVLFSGLNFSAITRFLAFFGINADANSVNIVFSSVLAFVISVTNSYLLNNRFVFASGQKTFSMHLKAYFKTMFCYAITGLIISPAFKLFLNNMGVAYYIAGFVSLIITVPLNFLLNKFWAFRQK